MKQERKNFILGVIHEGLWGTAIGFFFPYTILPLALDALGQSASMVGLLAAVSAAGITLPQVFSAILIPPRFTHPRPLAFLHLPIALGPLAAGLGFALLPAGSVAARLVLLFTACALFGFGVGIVSPHWIAAIGRCIRAKRRGRYFGTSFLASYMAMTLTSSLASRWVGQGGLHWGFALCFLTALLPMLMSILFLSLMRPLDKEPKPLPPGLLGKTFGLLTRKVLEPSLFRVGMALTVLLIFAMAPGNLYTVFLRQTAHMDLSWFQVFSPAMTVGLMGGAYLLGKSIDDRGLRAAFALAFAAGLTSLALAFWAVGPVGSSLAFFLSGFICAGPILTIAMILRLAGAKETTLQAGLFNTLLGPWNLAGPVLVGGLASFAGYGWAFSLAAACCLAAFGILLRNPGLDRRKKNVPGAFLRWISKNILRRETLPSWLGAKEKLGPRPY